MRQPLVVVVAAASYARAAPRVAALVTGHCDARAHLCDARAFESAAQYVFEPIAAVAAALEVFVCSADVAAPFNAGFASAVAGRGLDARVRFVDVFDEAASEVTKDPSQQVQFSHRRRCYERVGGGYDWYVQMRPDFVYFAPLFSGPWPFGEGGGGDRVYSRVFDLEASCGRIHVLSSLRLSAAHLSTGWWDPCRDAVRVKRTPMGVLRVSFDDQFAVVAGNASLRYFDGMVRADRHKWLGENVKHPRLVGVVPLDLHPKKATPEGFYTWGILHEQLDWRPLAVQGRLSRMVEGHACQTCSLSFPPEVDAGYRARACGCSAPRADAADAMGCGLDACRPIVNLTTGRPNQRRKRVWSRTPS